MSIKIFIGLACLVIVDACTSQRSNRASADVLPIEYEAPEDYQVVETKIISETDTLYTQELRIYKITSAIDASLMMHHHFGEANAFYEGKYQDNIKQHVWREVMLIDSINKFTVITDGTETGTEYFASIMVFDKENNNCLKEGHPLREVIVVDLLYRIGGLKEKNYKDVR